MLTIKIICVGKLKEKYWREAIEEYSKRLHAFCSFSVAEAAEEKISDNPNSSDIDRTIDREGARIAELIPKGAYVVSMCIEGKKLSSTDLAQVLENTALDGKSTVAFIIGGSFGLSETVKKMSDLRLSMSDMTFPHQLARVMLCEQIYRAFQINSGGKYHK